MGCCCYVVHVNGFCYYIETMLSSAYFFLNFIVVDQGVASEEKQQSTGQKQDLAVFGYAVRFLKYNCNLPHHVKVDCLEFPDVPCDIGSTESLWQDQLTEVCLFFRCFIDWYRSFWWFQDTWPSILDYGVGIHHNLWLLISRCANMVAFSSGRTLGHLCFCNSVMYFALSVWYVCDALMDIYGAVYFCFG